MTKRELRAERRLEKVRAKVVQAELARLKREQQIKDHMETIFSILTGILLLMLLIAAFAIDAMTVESIPLWVYAVCISYIGVYSYLLYKRLTK